MKTDKYIKSIAISLAASASLGIATTAMADTIVVDCMGSGDYETLQEAVDAAESGDTINVLPCTYFVDGVDKNVHVDSKELYIVSTEGPETTIIKVDKDWSIKISGVDPAVILDGFTIRQSDAGAQTAVRLLAGELTVDGCVFRDNGEYAVSGGAIYASNFDRLLVTNSLFKRNHAVDGGAIYAQNANPGGIVEIYDTEFISNEATKRGGAVYLQNTPFLIYGVDFIRNEALSDSAGALYYRANNPDYFAKIESTFFSRNTAQTIGGAILFDRSTTEVLIQHCRFEKNSVTGDFSYGGAVETEDSYSRFENCVFSKNQSHYGGAVDVYNSDSSFVECEFEKNKSVHGGGGGVYIEDASVFFDDVTLTKNKTNNDGGGGIICWNSTVEFSNVDFSKNKAVEGGGLYAHSSTVTLTDSLFERNKATISDEGSENIGGAISMIDTTINLKNLEVLKNKTGESIGGISLLSCAGKIGKCTIEDNQDHGLKLVDSPTVEIKKTTSCGNDAKDIKGDYIDEGDNTFCKE